MSEGDHICPTAQPAGTGVKGVGASLTTSSPIANRGLRLLAPEEKTHLAVVSWATPILFFPHLSVHGELEGLPAYIHGLGLCTIPGLFHHPTATAGAAYGSFTFRKCLHPAVPDLTPQAYLGPWLQPHSLCM